MILLPDDLNWFIISGIKSFTGGSSTELLSVYDKKGSTSLQVSKK